MWIINQWFKKYSLPVTFGNKDVFKSFLFFYNYITGNQSMVATMQWQEKNI